MEEGGKKLPEIAPEVTKETKEPAFDLAIEVALGYEPTVEERKLLETATDQESLFIERLERTQEDIDAFFNKVEARFDAGKGHPKKIRMALQVMLKIHADQEDRKDTGKSFLSHPIAVASRVLDMTTRYTDFDELADLCVAALLHDSIEDQARLLELEQHFGVLKENPFDERSNEEKQRGGALSGLERLFGVRVRFLVSAVTSPLKPEEKLESKEKNTQYLGYIRDIFDPQEQEGDYGPSIIKWADLQENALTIGILKERIENTDDPEKVEELKGFHAKVKEKYKPVLEAVLFSFENLSNTSNPLYGQEMENAIENIQLVLEHEYHA